MRAVTGKVRAGDHGVLASTVCSATFTALTVLVWAVEFGLIVATGVLIDTLLVRSVLVPALLPDIGERVWWPSRGNGAETRARPAHSLTR